MQKYYQEKTRLTKFADKVLTTAKTENKKVNIDAIQFLYATKFDCSWKAFTKRIKHICTLDPRFKLEGNVVSYDPEGETNNINYNGLQASYDDFFKKRGISPY